MPEEWKQDKPVKRNINSVLVAVRKKKNADGSDRKGSPIIGYKYKIIEFPWDCEDVIL